jgi:hypothetical protein
VIEDPTVEDPTREMDAAEPKPASDSLAARMREREEVLAKHVTERFPLPGWEELLEIELRVTGVQAATKATNRVQRVRDEGVRNLYVMVDLLCTATVQFWEVTPEGTNPIEDDWVSLAKRLPDCPDNPTARQAAIFLLKEHRIPWLYHDWESWQRAAKTEDVDAELRRDFGQTG